MTAAPITIELAGEPRGKGRPRFDSRTRRTYTDASTRSYEQQIAWAAQVAMGPRPPLEGPLAVTISAYVPIPTSWSRKRQDMAAAGLVIPVTRPDCDNYGKASLDGMNGIVMRDDSQVAQLTIVKRYSTKPRLVVTVSQVAPCDIEESAAA